MYTDYWAAILFSNFGNVMLMLIMLICVFSAFGSLYKMRNADNRLEAVEQKINVAVAMLLFSLFGSVLIMVV
jgi:hypothetical protein